jgi:L-aspartate oxidase
MFDTIPSHKFDVLIVGSGLAGVSSALILADKNLRVAIVTKRSLADGASGWAQGGMAAALSDDDTSDLHVADTLTAGAGLCSRTATEDIVGSAPNAISWLRKMGVVFSSDNTHPTGLHLTREGGHSQRRIVHAADCTGYTVQKILIEQVKKTKNITIFENYMLVDLLTQRHLQLTEPKCYGAYCLNIEADRVETMVASHTILATGGAGKVYLYSSNPDTATGDGIACAWRAGCRVANMEFIQFHPTCLYHPQAKSFLISEAIRGEGGRLLLPDGTRFMPAHDPRAELAPRDIVARAIDAEMKKYGLDCVYLDISFKTPDFLRNHFPTIMLRCLELGIDITREPIPVVPAAHYTCGGVHTNLQGRTNIPQLYAIGEAACTGLHGANRLASNSLVECVVMASHASEAILQSSHAQHVDIPPWDESKVTNADESVVIAHNWDELRRCMWNYVGIVRTNKRLERASHRIHLLQREITEFYANFRVSRDLLELRNLVTVSDLIVRSASSRLESRGLHFSLDYPDTLDEAVSTILDPNDMLHP